MIAQEALFMTLFYGACAAGLGWYRRYSERGSRRVWSAYFRFVRRER